MSWRIWKVLSHPVPRRCFCYEWMENERQTANPDQPGKWPLKQCACLCDEHLKCMSDVHSDHCYVHKRIYILISLGRYWSCWADAVVSRTQTSLCREKLMTVKVPLLMLILPSFPANWSRTRWRSFRRKQTVRWIPRGARLFPLNISSSLIYYFFWPCCKLNPEMTWAAGETFISFMSLSHVIVFKTNCSPLCCFSYNSQDSFQSSQLLSPPVVYH